MKCAYKGVTAQKLSLLLWSSLHLMQATACKIHGLFTVSHINGSIVNILYIAFTCLAFLCMHMLFSFSTSNCLCKQEHCLYMSMGFLSLSQPPAVYSNQQYQLNNNWVTVMYLLRDHNSLIRSEQFLETEEFFVSFAKLPHSKKCWVRGGLQTVDYSNQKMT